MQVCIAHPENIPDASHLMCVCARARVCVCYTAGINMLIGEDCVSCCRVFCMHTRRQYVACVIGVHWLKLHAHTRFVGM